MITLINRSSSSRLIFCGESGFVMDNLLKDHVLDVFISIQPRKVGLYYATKDTVEFELELYPFKNPLQQSTLTDFVAREGKFKEVKLYFGEEAYTFIDCIAIDFYSDKFLKFIADYYIINHV